MAPLGAPFHVGIVVADIAEARARLTDLLGVAWGPVMRLDEVDYRDAEGDDLVLPTTICYSTGQPAIELIEEVPGTIWVRNEQSNLHHLGFWADGLADGSASPERLKSSMLASCAQVAEIAIRKKERRCNCFITAGFSPSR